MASMNPPCCRCVCCSRAPPGGTKLLCRPAHETAAAGLGLVLFSRGMKGRGKIRGLAIGRAGFYVCVCALLGLVPVRAQEDGRAAERERMVQEQLMNRHSPSGRGNSAPAPSLTGDAGGGSLPMVSNRAVDEHLRIQNSKVLEAMRNVPRHWFVPSNMQSDAYADRPLPIGYGQTISQPYIVALMNELLDPRADAK